MKVLLRAVVSRLAAFRILPVHALAPNPSIERTSPGLPGDASHLKRVSRRWPHRSLLPIATKEEPPLQIVVSFLTIALLFPGSVCFAKRAAAPSNPNDVPRIAAEIRALESTPLTEESRRQRTLLFQWLTESPDVHLKWCAGILTDMPPEDEDYWAGVVVQVILSAAAFVMEHPADSSDDLLVARAGLRGALRTYRATLAALPNRDSPFLAALAAQEDAGKSDDYIRSRMSACK